MESDVPRVTSVLLQNQLNKCLAPLVLPLPLPVFLRPCSWCHIDGVGVREE